MQDLLKRILIAVLLCLIAPVAWADGLSEDEKKAAARQFLEQGIQAQEEGNHQKALAFLAKADGIYKHPGHGYYMGVSYAATGQLLNAHEAYRRFVLVQPTSDQMRELQQKTKLEMQSLEPRIPKLTIDVQEGSADTLKVLIDGKAIPHAALNAPMPVNPGKHTLTIESEAFELVDGALTLNVVEGASELVKLELKAVMKRVGEGNAVTPGQDVAPKVTHERSKRGKAFLIGGVAATGVGVAGVVLGSIFSANAAAKKSDREELFDGCSSGNSPYCSSFQDSELRSLADKEESARTSATVSFLAGGAALAAGASLLVIAGGQAKKEKMGRSVQPFVGVRSIGVAGRF